ncbi:MAG: hypothetical protein QOG63_2524 [Thermoleophilaceae bacterium]|nr:hypothetical protein [Thermoleophilaceae bacterium]
MRSIYAGLLLAATLATAGCGSPASPNILNTERVERAIESSSLAQRGQHVQVSCPAGVHQTKGLVFYCTAASGPRSTRFTVTQLDWAGQVHFEAR